MKRNEFKKLSGLLMKLEPGLSDLPFDRLSLLEQSKLAYHLLQIEGDRSEYEKEQY